MRNNITGEEQKINNCIIHQIMKRFPAREEFENKMIDAII